MLALFAEPDGRPIVFLFRLRGIGLWQQLSPVGAERLPGAVVQVIVGHHLFDQRGQLIDIDAKPIGPSHLDLAADAAAKQHVEAFARAEQTADAHAFQADVGGEVLAQLEGQPLMWMRMPSSLTCFFRSFSSS